MDQLLTDRPGDFYFECISLSWDISGILARLQKKKKIFCTFFQHFDFVSIFLKQECATPNGTYNLRFELDFRREFSRPSVDLTICMTKGKLQKYFDSQIN